MNMMVRVVYLPYRAFLFDVIVDVKYALRENESTMPPALSFSPDVNIEPNEIGIPPVFARKLTFPEPVTNHNVHEMRELVTRGPAIILVPAWSRWKMERDSLWYEYYSLRITKEILIDVNRTNSATRKEQRSLTSS